MKRFRYQEKEFLFLEFDDYIAEEFPAAFNVFWKSSTKLPSFVWPKEGFYYQVKNTVTSSDGPGLEARKMLQRLLGNCGSDLDLNHTGDNFGFIYYPLSLKPNCDGIEDLAVNMLKRVCERKDFSLEAFRIISTKLEIIVENRGCSAENIPVLDQLDNRMAKQSNVESYSIEPKYGFHSNINIQVTSPPKTKSFLVNHFSRDFFADPYELDRIRFDSANVTTFGHVDLEVPANSQMARDHFIVAQLLSPAKTTSLKLPFHLRYQPPTRTGHEFTNITFSHPILIDQSLGMDSNCPSSFAPSIIYDMINVVEPSTCVYFSAVESKDQIFTVPVGDASRQEFIANTTYLISFLGLFVCILKSSVLKVKIE